MSLTEEEKNPIESYKKNVESAAREICRVLGVDPDDGSQWRNHATKIHLETLSRLNRRYLDEILNGTGNQKPVGFYHNHR